MTVGKVTGILSAMTERQSKHKELDEQRVDALDRIAGELQLIRETLDHIRTDLQWWTQNQSTEQSEDQQEEVRDPRLLPVFYPGDRVTLKDGRLEATATVVDIDDAYNTAGIVVEPKGELQSVSQDLLSPNENDDDSASVTVPKQDIPKAPGQLF